ncbi:DUF4190 domain-containing protein [Microcella sp.]|uniref:DUF4190 domain-containing protein n=1 Tax=Microcella sp. TaxID=1913979 RepID=UPI0025608AE2|nr:DUF4190 domain-containing protein [Microcella sp.]MBX9471804.1 DUF4190 domain-containing protein [Microcella sp.]
MSAPADEARTDEFEPRFEPMPYAGLPHEAPPVARPRPKLNTLAVASLILAVMLSPLAALFGHIAAAQIGRSRGTERGAVIAWIAVGLGYVWLVGAIVIGVVVWRVLNG